MGEEAFVSFRLAAEERRRLKEVAARREVSLQELMREIVRERLKREGSPPLLAEILQTLRAHREELVQRGVTSLHVFGSTARGEAKPDSDVDLIVEVSPSARMSLTGFARLKQDLEGIIGRSVDLAEWRTLEPRLERSARRDAVTVF